MDSTLSLVNKFQNLIYKIAHQHARKNFQEDFRDLVQVGTMGLLRANKNFNPEKSATGELPSSYASLFIGGAILHYLRDNSLIKYPRSIKNRKPVLSMELSQIDNLLFENEKEDYSDLHAQIQNLSDRERQVLFLYYFEDKNDREIGEIIERSNVTAHRIRIKAERKLRNFLGTHCSHE